MEVTNIAAFIVERISALRIQKGVSELQMSRDLGKSPNYLRYIRKNKTIPSLPILKDICDYLGVSLTQFFNPDNQFPTCLNEINSFLESFSPEELANIKAFFAFAGNKKKRTIKK